MKLTCYNNPKRYVSESELVPQVAIFWQYFNGSPKKHLERRNKYRLKSGFAEIIDEGCYFTAELWIGLRQIGFNLEIRPPKYAPLGRPF